MRLYPNRFKHLLGEINLQPFESLDKSGEITDSCLNDNVEAEHTCDMYQTHSHIPIYLSCSINILDKQADRQNAMEIKSKTKQN